MEEHLETVTQVKAVVIDLAIRFGPRLMAAVIILVVGTMVGRWVSRVMAGGLDRFELEPPVRALLVRVIRLLVFGVAIGIFLWWLLTRTTVGAMIRAGVDDRQMLAASGVNVNLVFAITFMLGAGLAGFGGVIGAVELSMVPGEDTRLLLASLIVVIVGGMGSVVGAAVGAVILGLAETYGLAYAPTYSVVFTFLILIGVLAFRPRGIMGKPA